MSQLHELTIPEAAVQDSKSVEILRVWVANEEQHVVLRNVWDDPVAWGIMLADLARHIANACAEEYGFDPLLTLQRIKQGLDVELESGAANADIKRN